jgi:hypothetical protein
MASRFINGVLRGLGGKEVRFCGLAAQNALRASQAVREMSLMVNESLFGFGAKKKRQMPQSQYSVYG